MIIVGFIPAARARSSTLRWPRLCPDDRLPWLNKTTDPYLAGCRHRVVPTLGHLALQMITNRAVDRAVHDWIADDCSKSTVKNSLAVPVREVVGCRG